MKNSELIKRMGLLGSTGITKKKLPVKLTYGIHKNIKKLQDAADGYNTTFTALCEQYKVKQDANGRIDPTTTTPPFDQAVHELLDQDADVPQFYMIPMNIEEALEQCEKSPYESLTTEDLMAIDFMFRDEDDTE